MRLCLCVAALVVVINGNDTIHEREQYHKNRWIHPSSATGQTSKSWRYQSDPNDMLWLILIVVQDTFTQLEILLEAHPCLAPAPFPLVLCENIRIWDFFSR